MNTQSIFKYIKYIILYIVCAFLINYFFVKKSHLEENVGTVLLLNNNTITSSKPIQLDINLLKYPVNKTIHFSHTKDITLNTDDTIFVKTNNGTLGFHSFTGAPIYFEYLHPITKKLIMVFDYTNQKLENTYSPLLLLIDNTIINDYHMEYKENENNKKEIIFYKNYNGYEIKRIYKINDEYIDSTIQIENPKNVPIKSIKLLNQENSFFEKDELKGAYIYNTEDKIVKLTTANEISLLQSLILNPEIIGLQSTYFTQGIIQKNIFERAYFDFTTDESNKKYLYYFLEKSHFTSYENIDLTFKWYCRAKINSDLGEIDERLPLIMEYGFFAKLSNGLFFIVFYLVSLVHSLGLALIIFIIFCKLLVLPFGKYIKESNRNSKEFQQKLEYLKAKYHDDPKKKSEEEMLLIKKYGILPGFVARLPQVFNILIMISLPSFLKYNILLYQVPLGLWITDASLPDKYFILPIICFIFIYLHINNTKLTPMMKIGIIIFSCICLYGFAYFSSGMQLFILIGLISGYIENKIFAA